MGAGEPIIVPDVLRTIALHATEVAGSLGLVVDVRRDYGASGSALQTTGTIAGGSDVLTIAEVGDFQDGQGIAVAGAGAGGALLVTTIASGGGSTTLVLSTTAAVGVDGAVVSHDDTAAIQGAVAAVAGAGGMVWVGHGTYRISETVSLGNGNGVVVSDQNGIRLVGESMASTVLQWQGAAGGRMVAVLGPCTGNACGGLTIDGDGIATEGVTIQSGQYAGWGDLWIRNCANTLTLTTQPTTIAGTTMNCIGNVFGKLFLQPSAGSGSSQSHGLWVTGVSGVGDSNNNTFPNTHISMQLGYQTALRLGFCDFNIFEMTNVFGGGTTTGCYGLHVDGGVVSGFPNTNAFRRLNVGGAVLQTGSPGTSNQVDLWDTEDGATELPPASFVGTTFPLAAGGTVPYGVGSGAPSTRNNAVDNSLLTTTAAVDFSVETPADPGMYVAYVWLRVTATTVVSANWNVTDESGDNLFAWLSATSGAGGAATVIDSASLGAGSYTCVPVVLRYAGSGEAPIITVTAGTADQVYVSVYFVKI